MNTKLMPTGAEASKPRKKARASLSTLLAAVVLLTAMGSAALYLLGRPLPREAGSAPLAWGDRVERRMDSFIDGVKPKWADRVEKRMEPLADKVGWK